MQRMLKALPAALLAAAVFFPSVASAKDIGVGVTKTKLLAPTCPGVTNAAYCDVVLGWGTAIESKSDGVANPTAITTAGVISSFTVGVSELSSNATTRKAWLKQGDSSYGGPPKVRLSVLSQVGKASANNWRLVGQSPVYNVTNYLGKVVEFALVNPLPVTTGEVIAISTPTWAPIINSDLPTGQTTFSDRLDIASSNKTGCTSSGPVFNPSFVDDVIGEEANFGCLYPVRPEYSALEVTSP